MRALERTPRPVEDSDPALYLEVLGHVMAHYRLRATAAPDTEIDALQAARAASFERGLWLTGLRAVSSRDICEYGLIVQK
jgi:hypothetical protein